MSPEMLRQRSEFMAIRVPSVQFDCRPEQAFFAQRRIWASRAKVAFFATNNRAFGSLPCQTAPLLAY